MSSFYYFCHRSKEVSTGAEHPPIVVPYSHGSKHRRDRST